MRLQSTKPKPPKEEYLKNAKALSRSEAEQIMSRMRGRYSRRVDDERITAIEALALQLEFEDEQLIEWRARIAEIRARRKG
jgi:uncharacterized protein YeeX (DUF496 family)